MEDGLGQDLNDGQIASVHTIRHCAEKLRRKGGDGFTAEIDFSHNGYWYRVAVTLKHSMPVAAPQQIDKGD